MTKYLQIFFSVFFFALASCVSSNHRGVTNKNDPQKAANQDSQRLIRTSDIVVPEGYVVEVAAKGLSYPTDVTFDDEGNTYIAEAGGHTYGTKPGRAPEARILQVMADGTTAVLYNKVVPMNNIKEHQSSADMEEELIPPPHRSHLPRWQAVYFSPLPVFNI